jgi:RNA polymerase primary sigma factor
LIEEEDGSCLPEQVSMTQDLQAQVSALLDEELTQRERRVIELRFGIGTADEHSLSETGRKLGISHEAVRLIEQRALLKLKGASESRHLQEFLT